MKHLRRSTMTERPLNFRLDYTNPLADQLVFAGLGAYQGGTYYHDSTADLVGRQGNHGILTNMDPASDLVWDSTLGRWATIFDVINPVDGIVLPQLSISQAPLTLSCWIQLTGYTVSQTNVITLTASSWHGFSLYYGDWYLYAKCYDGATRYARAVFTLYSWVHVAAVFASVTDRRLYVNGNLAASDTASCTPNLTSAYYTRVGCLTQDGSLRDPFSGKLSDPTIHSRALSPSEISALSDPANVMLSGLILPPTRKLWRVAPVSSSYRLPLELLGAY